mmetsp:Transcript_4741/g.11924  ORF Transcript_4741/g.11924 Transcript_4741/m.11924 type:complete len:200 (+) Transcript_4741:194-793(+)
MPGALAQGVQIDAKLLHLLLSLSNDNPGKMATFVAPVEFPAVACCSFQNALSSDEGRVLFFRLVHHLRLDRDSLGCSREALDLIEVQVTVGGVFLASEFLVHFQVLLLCRQLAQNGRDRGELRAGEVDVRPLAEAVGEVTRRRRHGRGLGGDSRLIAHAKRAAGHFRAGPSLAVDAVKTLGGELRLVHLRRRGDPKPRG